MALARDAVGEGGDVRRKEPLGRAAVVALKGTQGWKWAVNELGSSICLMNNTASAGRFCSPTYSSAISIPLFFSFSGDLVPAHTNTSPPVSNITTLAGVRSTCWKSYTSSACVEAGESDCHTWRELYIHAK